MLIDFGLDFVAEDYNITDQNLLGTLLYNIGNIIQTHYHDITYSWVRSYDSYYSDIKFVCPHNYGEWSIVKEATTEDYGVQMKTCTHCGESMYEAIPKIVDNATVSSASLFGEGSVIVIVLASIAMIATGAAIYFYVRPRKVSSTVEKDDEG